ncbi:hypothetical protein BDD12DRAFT_807652 [Trichophaea hybrida]|nr:hypothetical protein BDD12DRAFT_807652 [Trichophaea hybrida]
MSTETHTVMDPPKLNRICVYRIGSLHKMRKKQSPPCQWTWRIRIRRRTTYEIPVYLLQIRQSYIGRMQKVKHAQSEISTSRSTKDKSRIRKGGNDDPTVTKADSLVTSRLIACTMNEFKSSVLKLRKPAGDRDF